jgi:hypothetical protein
MTALTFSVVGARPAGEMAAPAIVFRLRIESDGPVHAIALRCQIQIEARGRRYSAADQEKLYELFGEPSQWHHTLRTITWTQTSVVVPSFDRTVEIDLPVACTYDLLIASSKYLHGMRDGGVPLSFQFSGTTFTTPEGRLAIEPVPWDREARVQMSAAVWHEAMDRLFPDSGWIRLRRDTIDRLQAFRGRNAFVEWDEVIDRLLQGAETREPV